MAVQPAQAREIFLEAIAIAAPERRAEFLDGACAGDDRLQRRVEALIEAHERPEAFLDGPAVDGLESTLADETTPLGISIGPYCLLEAIGEGGMGTVYMAEQTEPVRRRVALKVIKPGMDSKQVVARFEAERQALALMDHPGIARVLDGGMTPEGRPYFVMELVRGLPITEYCDREELTIAERLELFVLVCRAVQHAHQKGVIHRDLKPSNVMVTVIDGTPTPKVIDFGVAKATGESLTDRTLFTAFHQLVGTPLYMSPEQADLAGSDVDTRSDIYSLGVLLYELLTGTTPFDSDTLKRAAFDEMRRILREQEPPRPSTRLSALGDKLSTISARRKADPKRLGSSLRGELDWVVMRTLEKDRRRRYETASDLAADVMNYLTDRPVEACPPSTSYRLAKLARRNRAALTTLGLVALTLVVGLAASAWQAVRATTSERRAEDHLALARQAVDELYDEVAARWTDNLEFAPLPRPFLEKALPFYERFADSRRADLATGRANRVMGEILIQLGRRREAHLALDRATAIFRALRAVDPGSPEPLENLAATHLARGVAGAPDEVGTAASMYEEHVARAPSNARYRRDLARSYHLIGVGYRTRARSEAVGFLRRAREIQERLCAEAPADPDRRSALGMTLRDLGCTYRDVSLRLVEGESHVRRALAIHDELVTRHPTRPQFWLGLGWSCFELGWTMVAAQKNEEALGFSTRAATIFEGLANEYPNAGAFRFYQAQSVGVTARAHYRLGHRAEGAQAVRKMIALGHGDLLRWLGADFVYQSFGPHPGMSDPLLGIELLMRSEEARPDETAFTQTTLGIGHYRAEELDSAIRVLDAARGLCKKKDAENASISLHLAMAYHRKGDPDKARASYETAMAWMKAYHPTKVNPLGDAFLVRTRAEAEALLGVGGSRREPPPGTGPDATRSPR